jgi:ATP-dependent exoDNAse (exonuclease V) alpha subunit
MSELTTKEYTYHATRTGVYGDYVGTRPSEYIYEKDYPAEKDLTLKEGAQIMMLKNNPEKKWVNGTMGIIKQLEDDCVEVTIKGQAYFVGQDEWQAIGYVYDTETGKVTPRTFTQYPIRLAWAIIIHKSQGKTFDKITVDLSGGGAFAYGQTYVALSRCTSLEGILLADEIKPKDIETDPLVIQFVRDSSAAGQPYRISD